MSKGPPPPLRALPRMTMANKRPSADFETPTPTSLQSSSKVAASLFAQYSTKTAPVCGPRSFKIPCNLLNEPKPDRAANESEVYPGTCAAAAAESLSPRAKLVSFEDTLTPGLPAFRRSAFNEVIRVCSVPVATTFAASGAAPLPLAPGFPAQPIINIEPKAPRHTILL